jgi:predicted peptidase
MKEIKLVLLAVLLSAVSTVKAQDLNLYERSTYVADGDTLPYRIAFPENFDNSKKYPLVLFLHGAGERGNDNQAQLTHGGKLFVSPEVRKNFPAIVVFPQCLKDSFWSNVKIITDSTGKRLFEFQKGGTPTNAMAALLGLTERLLEKPFVDQSQVYVGGLSMGGMGTFELLRRKPNVFAAAFAVCGGDNVKNVKKYKKLPLWVFHGSDDNVVPVAHSEEVVNALRDKGSDVKFTIYPGVKHNSWENAFAEPQLLPWLFSQSN